MSDQKKKLGFSDVLPTRFYVITGLGWLGLVGFFAVDFQGQLESKNGLPAFILVCGLPVLAFFHVVCVRRSRASKK